MQFGFEFVSDIKITNISVSQDFHRYYLFTMFFPHFQRVRMKNVFFFIPCQLKM